MKYIKPFEDRQLKQVYWIVPFTDKFEDSVVRLLSQYSTTENRIEVIDKALRMSNDARRLFPKEDFIIINMVFFVNDDVVSDPSFDIVPENIKDGLEEKGFIFVGYYNTTKEDYLLKKSKEKYNI